MVLNEGHVLLCIVLMIMIKLHFEQLQNGLLVLYTYLKFILKSNPFTTAMTSSTSSDQYPQWRHSTHYRVTVNVISEW